MKGSRELNNMKDTPSFKIKKVLALSKLRHSSVAGKKPTVSGTSVRTTKKLTNEKMKTDPGDKTVSSLTAVIKRKGRPSRTKVKEVDDPTTTGSAAVEHKKGGEQKVKDEILEKKVVKEETVNESSNSGGRKKFVKKQPKILKGSKPERNLRSQIGEMLMRHGKKITKAPVPKRKRTLSADFELLDERSLKRTLKETAEAASGTENDSDASAATDGLGMNVTKNMTKKKMSAKSRSKDTTTLDSSWIDCPSPLVDTGKKLSKTPKSVADSRDSSLDGSEAGVTFKRHGKKQRTVRKQTDTKISVEGQCSQPPATEKKQDLKGTESEEHEVYKPRKRGRPPKRKRVYSQSGNINDRTKTDDKSYVEKEPVISKCGTKLESELIAETELNEDSVLKKQRLNIDENSHDPYSFCGVDLEEEDVDNEISFKPTGICGEVKRKPGRPNHETASQPAVKALKVKSTHKLLISDQKPKPFSRVRGGRILKASQIYRGSGRKRRLQPLQMKALVVDKSVKDPADVKDQSTNVSCDLEDNILPVITPLNIVIAEQEADGNSPLSPEMQHPDLTIIKDLISPAPSNEDLEPPVLELANIDPCLMHVKQADDEKACIEEDGSLELGNEENVTDSPGINEAEPAIDKTNITDNREICLSAELPKVPQTEFIGSDDQGVIVSTETAVQSTLEDEHVESKHEGQCEELLTFESDIMEAESEIIIETTTECVCNLESQTVETCSGIEELADTIKCDTDLKFDSEVHGKMESSADEPLFSVEEAESDAEEPEVPVEQKMLDDKQLESDIQELESVIKESEIDVQSEETQLEKGLSEYEVKKATDKTKVVEKSEVETVINKSEVETVMTKPELETDPNESESSISRGESELIPGSDELENEPIFDKSELERDVKKSELETSTKEIETCLKQPEVEDGMKVADLEMEEVIESVVENCMKNLLDSVDDMMQSVSRNFDEDNLTEKKEDILEPCEQVDGNSDSDLKEKDHKYEVGGIKMKLKRHKGKFKVTRLSEEDESLLDGVEHSDTDANSNFKLEQNITQQDDVILVMKSILDEIETMIDDAMLGDSVSPHSEQGNRNSENDVFTEVTDVESANSSSYSDISPTDSEKRVPPLTIRLKSGKTGKKPVRKFELRPKFSRSPIEIIAMRQKRYEEEYDKNEATRLAKKLEKQIGKKKNLMKTAFKDINIAETGLANAEKAGNIDELMDLCTPCTVSVVDFVKQLNLQPDEEEIPKTSSLEENETADDTNTESQITPASDLQKKGQKKKSQFKSGRPRGRPPKLKNKLPTTPPTQPSNLKPNELSQPKEEKDAVDGLQEVGFVGSFVEFLKSKKKEKPKTGKIADGTKVSKKSDIKSEQTKTDTQIASPMSVTPPTASETVKAKHLSGDRKPGVRYVCNKCEFSSVVQKTMVFHVYSHIPGVSFKCGYCNKDFLSMVGASAHSKNEHHGKESKIIKSKDLNESELYHVVEEVVKVDTAHLKPLESGQLGGTAAPGQMIISFLVGSNLALKASTKRFVCTHCEYSTDILEDVQQHCKDLHSTDNMFACILCADAYFSSEETVKNHNFSTHPTRPQSYRKLPSYYDIEQMQAAEKAQLEDRGNIFDKMNNLFSTSSIGDEVNNENPRKAHYQRARDFLYVQEGWKNKTSAEADSTTILDNESGGLTSDVSKESPAALVVGPTVLENETVGTTERNTIVSDKEAINHTMDSEISLTEKKSLSEENEKCQDKTDMSVSHCSKDKEEQKTDNVQTESRGLTPNAGKDKSENTDVDRTQAAPVITPSGCAGQASPVEASIDAGTKVISKQSTSDNTAGQQSDGVSDDKSDDSGVSNLKIIDVVSLRDQSSEQSAEAVKNKVSSRSPSQTSRGSSNLPEVDVDALVMRNERITCTYKCMKCNIHSPYLSAMVEHLKHYHSEITLFTCPYCRGFNSQKPEFRTEVNVHEHVKKVHPSNCAKNEVSLSDTAKTFVQVLAIPSGVECNKVGNTFVIEKDIYMCLKCQAHMPSLDYTFGHLEREHPDAFVQVCPLCKTFKDKSDEVVFGHIMKEHKQDPNDHPLSVAIEDNLFVRIPSISKSGAYNDRVNPSKFVKGDSNRKVHSKSSVASKLDDSEDDVLVVGETKNLSRPSAIRATGTLAKRGRPALISQGSGSITTAPRVLQKNPIRFPAPEKSATMQQLHARALLGVASRLPPPKSKVTTLLKSNSEQSQGLMMDCESIDDPVNTITDVVEDHGDADVPGVTATNITNSANIGSIVDSSNVISHSVAIAVASSVVSVATTVQMTTTVPSVTQSSTTTTAVSKQVGNTSSLTPPLKKLGVNSVISSKADVTSSSSVVSEAKPKQTTDINLKTPVSLPGKTSFAEKAKELKISRPKSSLFSMTDKLHRLHARAAEREREKERAALQSNVKNSSSVDSRSSPQTSRESALGVRSSPHTSRSSPIVNSGQTVIPNNRPVLKVPSYTSIPRAAHRQVSATPPNATALNHNVQSPVVTQVQRKSLLFRNCPLDLSRTPSPATTPVSSNSHVTNPPTTTPTPKAASDDLPPDAFKIFNLKPDARRQKSTPPSSSTVTAASPVTQILGNTIPNIVGTLAPPGTLLQQVQALPYTQLAQMQMAGVPLNPLQLQGLCIPAPNNSFVLANIPQQPGTRPNIPSPQIPQMHIRSGSATSVTTSLVSQAQRPSSAKTVAQALAERSQSGRHVLPQPRALPKQHIPAQSILPMNKTNSSRMAQQDHYCPYCSQFRPLRDYEVKPHIERCHPGKEVLFFKLS